MESLQGRTENTVTDKEIPLLAHNQSPKSGKWTLSCIYLNENCIKKWWILRLWNGFQTNLGTNILLSLIYLIIFWKNSSFLIYLESEWKIFHHNLSIGRIKIKIHETPLEGWENFLSIKLGRPEIPQLKKKMPHQKEVKISLLSVPNKWFTFWM